MLKPIEYLPATALDQMIFDATVPADHFLRRVLDVIDFDAFRDLMASAYHPSMGRKAIEPILMLKLEFLQFHYGLSDREVIKQCRPNMAYRYFLGLSLKSPLPHHTLLTYFRQRLGDEKHRELFDNLVAQARKHGLIKDRLRLKDATHIIANIAIPSTIELVAQTRQKLLDGVRSYDPQRVGAEEQRAQQIQEITADLSGEERLLQRVTHLRSILAWVDEVMQQSAAAKDQVLAEVVQFAHKVLADRKEPKSKEKTDRVVSAHDEEARWGNHHGWYAGYQLDMITDADSEIITAIDVQPANADEAANTEKLIRHEEAVHGNDVKCVSIDGIGYRGDVLRELTNPEDLNLEVIVPPKPEMPTEQYGPDQFTLNEERTELTCPAGQTTTKRERNRHDTGWRFHFVRATCAGCPLQAQCMKKPPKSIGRIVMKNDYEAEYRAARAKAQTEAYKKVRKEHPRIERKHADMIRWHGARHARYRGQRWVRLQTLMTGIVVNVKRMVRLLTAPAGTVCAETG